MKCLETEAQWEQGTTLLVSHWHALDDEGIARIRGKREDFAPILARKSAGRNGLRVLPQIGHIPGNYLRQIGQVFASC
jgi:hypothetical protein